MEKGTTRKNDDVTSKMGNLSRRNINSNHTSVNDVLVFLTELYETGVGYSALKTAESALSNVVTVFVKPFNEKNIQLSTVNAEIYSVVGCFSCVPVLKVTFLEHISLVLLWVIITINYSKDHSQR